MYYKESFITNNDGNLFDGFPDSYTRRFDVPTDLYKSKFSKRICW